MRSAIQNRGSRAGFTMIELLTVMGIIIILLSILLPVIASVRRKSYEAATQAQIARLATTCQNYFQDFSSYPGPLPEYMIIGFGGTGPSTIPGPITAGAQTYNQLTSTENLTLGIVGGLKPASGTTPLSYDPTLLLKGPQSLNAANPKQYPAYYDPAPGELTADVVGNYISVAGVYTQPVSRTPTLLGLPVPELNDKFPVPAEKIQQHPIIYLRARIGGTNAVLDAPLGTASAEYYSQEMAMYGYLFPTPADPNNNSQVNYVSSIQFFQNPTLNDGYTPRGRDAFLLISAGFDGLFGTTDDIVYPQN